MGAVSSSLDTESQRATTLSSLNSNNNNITGPAPARRKVVPPRNHMVFDRRPVEWVRLKSAEEIDTIFKNDNVKDLMDGLNEDTINLRKYATGANGGNYYPTYYAVKHNAGKCTEALIKLHPNVATFAVSSLDTTTMYEMALNESKHIQILTQLQLQQMKLNYDKIRLIFIEDKTSLFSKFPTDVKMRLLEIYLFYLSVSTAHIEQKVRAQQVQQRPINSLYQPLQVQQLLQVQAPQQPQPVKRNPGPSMMYASQSLAYESREKPVISAGNAKPQLDMEAAAKRKREIINKLPTACTHCSSPLTPEMTVELKTGEIISYCKTKGGCAKSHICYVPPDLTGISVFPPSWPKWNITKKTWEYQ